VQDKLELALGEVDILRKQIEREKAQFEQALVVRVLPELLLLVLLQLCVLLELTGIL